MPVEAEAQQGVLALHTARALPVKQRAMLANAMRGLAAEFGLVAPQDFARRPRARRSARVNRT